jgi:hypothetical protein
MLILSESAVFTAQFVASEVRGSEFGVERSVKFNISSVDGAFEVCNCKV